MNGSPPLLCASIRGFAAFVFAQRLDLTMREWVADAEQRVVSGRLDPAYVGEVVDAWAQVRRAGEEWVARERAAAVSPVSPLSPPVGETAARSEVTTVIAAEMLGLKSRQRVGQLLRLGVLRGHLVWRGGRQVWRVDVESIKAFRSEDGARQPAEPR